MTTILDMPASTYHAHPAISRSMLDEVDISPAHFKAKYLDGTRTQETTEAMDGGSVLHTLVLEPERFEERFYVAPKCDLRTKVGKSAWAEAEAEAGPRTIIEEPLFRTAQAQAESIRSHRGAAAMLSRIVQVEASHFWIDGFTGLDCKCRPDAAVDVNGERWLVDMKRAINADPRTFNKVVANRGYHRQGAHYRLGHSIAEGVDVAGFVFIACEPEPPYAVSLCTLDAQFMEAGRRDCDRLLRLLAECKASGRYPAYGDEVHVISAPRWMEV